MPSALDAVENEALRERIAARIGNARAYALFDMTLRRQRMAEGKQRIIARWELFRLLDPAYGPPSVADRATVRLAAAEILADLRNVDIAADYSLEIARGNPVTRRSSFNLESNVLPVRNCSEVWANGTAYRKPDPGERAPY